LKKELRKQIKQDELVSGFAQAWYWVEAHRDEVKVTATVLAVVAVGAAAVSFFQGQRAREAEQAFSAALEIYHGSVVGEQPEGTPPSGPVYPTAGEKYKKAAAAFDGVERRFGPTPVGLRAKYYGALCRIELGEIPVAQAALADVAARKEHPLESALARLALADVLRRTGAVDKAVDAYRQIIDDASVPLPRDHALMTLATTLEEARRIAEAKASYRRLTEEFPTSVYAGEARRRAAYLETGAQG
jgi:tetratricopeptide (TPR) repeat protein